MRDSSNIGWWETTDQPNKQNNRFINKNHQVRKPNQLTERRTKFISTYIGMEKNLRFKEVSELRIKMDSERMKLDLQLKDLQIYMEERESRKV